MCHVDRWLSLFSSAVPPQRLLCSRTWGKVAQWELRGRWRRERRTSKRLEQGVNKGSIIPHWGRNHLLGWGNSSSFPEQGNASPELGWDGSFIAVEWEWCNQLLRAEDCSRRGNSLFFPPPGQASCTDCPQKCCWVEFAFFRLHSLTLWEVDSKQLCPLKCLYWHLS